MVPFGGPYYTVVRHPFFFGYPKRDLTIYGTLVKTQGFFIRFLYYSDDSGAVIATRRRAYQPMGSFSQLGLGFRVWGFRDLKGL